MKYTEPKYELIKHQEREEKLIQHISTLEKEIQKKIQVDQFKENESNEKEKSVLSRDSMIQNLLAQTQEYNIDGQEFQLKIKSQDDSLVKLHAQLQQQRVEIENLKSQIEHLQAENPNNKKLLPSLESDKVAASRSLQQTIELKKQLDELEVRFVQLTNDKADLVNRLDSEIFSTKGVKLNYLKMEERIQQTKERSKFKDKERIRLSNENMALQSKNYILEQQIQQIRHFDAEKY